MAPALHIRRARPDEAARLTETAFAAKRHWGYPEAWIEAWQGQLTFTPEFVTDHGVYAAADAEGGIVACYALVQDERGLQLEHVWVSPAFIRRGIGRVLFAHAADRGRALGATALLIDSDPNAEAFYLRMGAERVGTIRADVCEKQRELPQLRYDLNRT